MLNRRKEYLVGCLVIVVLLLVGVFGWLLGAFSPFSSSVTYHLLYGFAGGVEKGSAVRVAGVKVGRVENIEFLPETSRDQEDPVALKVTIHVAKDAAPSIRKNSKFFVNMAGIIGERYIEISPGTLEAARLEAGETVRGVDPPRIDQLLSQGFNVFGKLQAFMEENEESVSVFLKDMSKMIKGNEWRKLIALVDNVNAMTSEIRVVTKKLNQPTGQEVFDKLYDLIGRAHEIDKETLKQFLQEEGIRARIF